MSKLIIDNFRFKCGNYICKSPFKIDSLECIKGLNFALLSMHLGCEWIGDRCILPDGSFLDFDVMAGNDGLYEFIFFGESIRINYSGHPSGMISQLVHNVVSLFIFKKGARVDIQLDVVS